MCAKYSRRKGFECSRMNLSQTGCESERWKELAQDHVGCQALVLVVLIVVRNTLVR